MPDSTIDDRFAVVHLADVSQYELQLDGARVGYLDYSLADGVATIPHVETSPEHRGKDFAARLMNGALDHLRAQRLTVRPVCPYASAYMRRHPDTHDLIAS